RDPAQLWNHLASRLLQGGDEFETQATLLLLVYAGTSANAELPLDRIAALLTELGWRHGDGRPLEGHELYRLSTFHLLENVSDQPVSWRTRNRLSTAAAALARAALCRRRMDGL
ncbi:MAG TPA: plasmid pRiA4b ORF-3 family protein, partial [Mycobacterium sp.]